MGQKKIDDFAKKLVKAGTVAVDTNCFIYLLESHPVYEASCHRMFSQAEKGEIDLVSSVVTLTELLVQPLASGNTEKATEFKQICANMPGLTIVPIDSHLAELAAMIRAESNYRLPDAYQLAAGLSRGATVFVTNDQRLKSFRQMAVLLLSEVV